MRRLFETIKELVLLFILISCGSALIDYARINAGKIPLFCIKIYDSNTKIETYQGILYSGSRKVSNNSKEELVDSTEIQYKIFDYSLSVPSSFHEEKYYYQLVPHMSEECNSTLYYADADTKLYLYCISSIDYIENDRVGPFSEAMIKNSSLLEDFLVKNTFVGLIHDSSMLKYQSNNDLINPSVTIYRCHQSNSNDIYILPEGTPIQDDFCTFKNDDYNFIWRIIDENKTTSDALEIIYEDGIYTYELPEGNKNNIYIYYPGVRGREEEKIPLMDIITSRRYTIDELISRGLNVIKTKKGSN